MLLQLTIMSECGERADDTTVAGDAKEKRWHLPPALALLTDCDRKKFLSALELNKSQKSSTYGQSFLCVHSVVVESKEQEGGETVVDLKGLFAVEMPVKYLISEYYNHIKVTSNERKKLVE